MTLPTAQTEGPIDLVLLPPVRDLGDGFQVRRALPSAKRRMVGPFIFFDQMGPVELRAGQGLDVRPHPHIGLATVTYLLQGEIMHRDSVGSTQPIRPGEVNWMTAGRGIVHSERSGEDRQAIGRSLLGLQSWVALPTAHEETEPGFFHHDVAALPEVVAEGKTVRLIAGSLFGLQAPVKTFSDMMYADITLAGGARLQVPTEHIERAIYVMAGTIQVEGQAEHFTETQLVIFKPDAEIVLRAHGPARVMLLGGEPFPEKRYIYWNFVSSSLERIEQAKQDWQQRRFDNVPGDDEYIPLPDGPPGVKG